jgi:DNA-binding MarR family transcriptional regulator
METDFVDDAVDGWAKQLPRVKTSALEITGRLDRIARLLERRSTDALNNSGLSCRDLDVLGALRRDGSAEGLPAGELARAAMLTSGGMTGQADRLANAGLIVRRPDPDDRRTVLMALTAEGKGLVQKALESYLGASEEVLQVLTENERRVLAELLRKLLVGLEGPKQAAEAAEPARAPRSKTARSPHRFESA